MLAAFAALPFRVSGADTIDAWTFDWEQRQPAEGLPTDGKRVRIRCDWPQPQTLSPGQPGYREAQALLRQLVEGAVLTCGLLVAERWQTLDDPRLDYKHPLTCRVVLPDGRDLSQALGKLHRQFRLQRALQLAPPDAEPIPAFLLRR